MPEKFATKIKSLLPHSLRLAVGQKLSKLGYRFLDVEDRETFPCHHLSLKILRAKGFKPTACLDIGAHDGEWTLLFKSIFPETRVLMLDALESKRETLAAVAQQTGSSFEIALLGAEDGRKIAFHEMGTGSSVLAEISSVPRQTVEKVLHSLDVIVKNHAEIPAPIEFIKLDVQGYELEVLRGATATLSRCMVVFLEVSLAPSNAGAPLIAEVMAFMHERGFQLFDFCSQTRGPSGVLRQTDLLFVRQNSSLIEV